MFNINLLNYEGLDHYTDKLLGVIKSSSGGLNLLLESISVTTPPTKTSYKSGETFDPNGMVITGLYNEGFKNEVTGYTVAPLTMTEDVTEITITYTEGLITKTTSTPVNVVKTISALTIASYPSKTTYNYMEVFDPSGMTLTATFTDGTTASVTDYTYSNDPLAVLGEQPITISYTYEGVTRSISVLITVNAIVISSPSQSGSLVYDGSEQSPIWDDYDSVKMEASGDLFATNAGNYSTTFTCKYGYTFSDGVGAVAIQWIIDRATIASVPSQMGVLTYNGNPQTPAWDSAYDASKMTLSVAAQTNAGTGYLASFTPKDNYKWADGSTTAKSVSWSIDRATIASTPAQSGSLTYNGSAQSPVWVNYDANKMTISSTAQTNAGSYTATFTPKDNYKWSDGSTLEKSVSWTIGRATITSVPAQSGSLTYNGNTQSPTWSDYDTNKMEVSVEAKINAGSYTATFTPNGNYMWSDGSVTAKSVGWSIGKASGFISVNKTEITFTPSIKQTAVIVQRSGNATISAVSGNTSLITITSINQNTGEISVKSSGSVSGSTTITISIPDTQNYTEASATITVSARMVNVYGVEWDWENGNSSRGVRIDDSANFSDPNPAVNNGTGSSPFDNLMPWSGMRKVNRTGGVMVMEPRYWFKWTKTGKKLKLQIADGPLDGFYTDPVNMARDDDLPESTVSYIGRYPCNNTNFLSQTACGLNSNRLNLTTYRETLRDVIGSNYYLVDFNQYWYIGMLYLVEFADWNTQKTIGIGGVTADTLTGGTDAMQYHTGTSASSRTSRGEVQYRNVERLWGSPEVWLDGMWRENTTTSKKIFVVKSPKKYMTNNVYGTNSDAIYLGDYTPSTDRVYPAEFTIPTEPGFEWALYPCAGGGSVNTYVTDRWYFPSAAHLTWGSSYPFGVSEENSVGLFELNGVVPYNSERSYNIRSQERG